MKRQKLSVEAIKDLIKEKRGNLSSIAKAAGWSRTQVFRFVHAHPTLVEALEDARDEMRDAVQSEFYRACLDQDIQGHVTAMIFFLKTQCGWVEKQDIGLVTDNTKVTVYLPDNNRGD